jgi:hypothetical protein
MSKGRAERVRKTTIRLALDKAKWPRRDGKYRFLPEEVEKVKAIVLAWTPKPKKARKGEKTCAERLKRAPDTGPHVMVRLLSRAIGGK